MSERPAPPYQGLTPETILDAVESVGLLPDGTFFPLNSYENRVYQIGLEDESPIVAKFYRPGRWSSACILEEHAFSLELAKAEIPVIAPLPVADGSTLHEHGGFRFALFPRRGGRWPELSDPDSLAWIGRYLGRIHALGTATPFRHRPSLDPVSMGVTSSRHLLENRFIPVGLESTYRQLTDALHGMIAEAFATAAGCRRIRLHGDCHPGNILWTDGGPHFVDMDDCMNGPAVQDLWMLLSGERDEMMVQLAYIREGYEVFRRIDPRELALIEPLRTLRMIHYAAWIARRWDDPAFPAAFPWFNTHSYWQEHLAQLEQQMPALAAPPLPLL